MVYYFSSSVVDPPAIIYMGRDKEENEDLIKHGWEEDVWYETSMNVITDFHVHPHSSAHVYLRLQFGQSWENIPTSLLTDLGQLVKANSIAGILGMLHHDLQQNQPKILKKNSKDQILSTDLINTADTENSSINLFFEEERFEEPLEYDVEAVSIDMNDVLVIEEFFEISNFRQDNKVINESSSSAIHASNED
ncbi:11149_t:CDS:2 [Scutellospora calospora]|uniref:11149_t:CDS:1 n=1 Tax=Scutellospora calospora TaxID=85575 RepID=A0ACA9JVT4_9GLOM|nr:11149_t:CDS:2 [Scutellospora calospora]